MKMHIRTAPLALAAALTIIGVLPLTAQEVLPLTVRRAWLGFAYDEVDGEVVVRDVVPESPADRAGLRIDDRILRVDGEPATTGVIVDLGRRMSAGDTIRLRIRSGDGDRSIEVVAAPRPTALVRLRPGGDVVALRPDTLETTIRALLDSARLSAVGRPNVLLERNDSILMMRVDGEPIVILRNDSFAGGSRFRFRSDSTLSTWFGAGRAASADSVLSLLTRRADSVPRRIEETRLMLERLAETSGDRPVAPVLLHRTIGLGLRAVAGAEFSEMNEGLAAYFDADEGLLVLRVLPDTPASRAGLEAGDVVIRAAGRAVRSIDDLRFVVAGHPEDEPIELVIVRRGERRMLRLEHEE